MFRKPVSVVCLLSAARVNRQLILLTSVHVSDSVCMCTVREVKVNLYCILYIVFECRKAN